MKKPVNMIRNTAGVYVATKLSERFVQRTRKKFGGSLVKLAVGGIVLYVGAAITGAVFGATLGAIWWGLTFPLYHPFLTAIVGVGTWAYFKFKRAVR